MARPANCHEQSPMSESYLPQVLILSSMNIYKLILTSKCSVARTFTSIRSLLYILQDERNLIHVSLIADIKIPNMLKAPNYQTEESSSYYLPTTNLSGQIVTIWQVCF